MYIKLRGWSALPPLRPPLVLLPPAGDGELDLAQNANANGNAESQREREREESSRKSDACDSGLRVAVSDAGSTVPKLY